MSLGATTVRAALVTSGICAFVVLATANAGGYRFGVSDQAFYEPAIRIQIDPTLFPHDRPLLEAQTRLMAADKIVGEAARVFHLSLPPLFFGVYVISLVLLAAAAIAVARALGLSWWATAALLFALTLRHRIPKTGANSLEAYMHPRQLAFAIGALGIAGLLRRRTGWMIVALATSMMLHPTTGLWFGVCLVPAALIAEPRWRRWLPAAIGIGAVTALLLCFGPLSSRFRIMDQPWLDVLADKDYLFPTEWPTYAWFANLGYAPLVWIIHLRRAAAGAAVANERALMAGIAALLLLFLISVPFTAWHVALAVQLQVTRVFWVMDFVATAFLAWWVSSSVEWRRVLGAPAARTLAVAVFATLSLARGYHVMRDQDSFRPLVQLDLPDTPWVDAMRWLRAQPPGWNILADPGHAWKFGLSIRVAAERDTVLESIKDSALGMYDRAVAMRVADRTAALMYFEQMTAADLRRLDTAYDLDAVIVEQPRTLELPVLYRNSQFTIYDLR